MANEEHLAVLRRAIKEKDISIWNEWRKENKDLKIDLSWADLSWAVLREAVLSGVDLREADLREAVLSGADLSGADLSGAVLSRADLREADLSRAVLSRAVLSRAVLREANLSGAVLSRAVLRDAVLRDADLSRADLSRAVLIRAVFSRAILKETNFNNAFINETAFNLTNLSTCKKLDSVEVSGPCPIDFTTLQASKPLPITFLRKIGLPDHYIEYLPDFFDENSLRLFPVFLSHNEKDKKFARKLYDQLIAHNVQVWFDERKIHPGDKLRDSISRAIDVYDKMILVCSENSLESWWVQNELEELLAKEQKFHQEKGKKVSLLIPITVDDKIFSWQDSLQRKIIKHNIGDFRGWQNPQVFDRALKKLIDALNVDRNDGGIISHLKKD